MPLAVLWKERQSTNVISEYLNTWGAQALADSAVGGGVVGGWALVHEHWMRVEADMPATATET